jgi:hypothetical protein
MAPGTDDDANAGTKKANLILQCPSTGKSVASGRGLRKRLGLSGTQHANSRRNSPGRYISRQKSPRDSYAYIQSADHLSFNTLHLLPRPLVCHFIGE